MSDNEFYIELAQAMLIEAVKDFASDDDRLVLDALYWFFSPACALITDTLGYEEDSIYELIDRRKELKYIVRVDKSKYISKLATDTADIVLNFLKKNNVKTPEDFRRLLEED